MKVWPKLINSALLSSFIHSFLLITHFLHTYTCASCCLFSLSVWFNSCDWLHSSPLFLCLCILTTSKVKPPSVFSLHLVRYKCKTWTCFSNSPTKACQVLSASHFLLSRPVSLQYAAWLVVWMTWNVFIICFYLEVGDLSRVRKQFFGLFLHPC